MFRLISALTVGHLQNQISGILRPQDTGYLIPELSSFEERMKCGCLDTTITSTTKN
jgi:hypothetical protein